MTPNQSTSSVCVECGCPVPVSAQLCPACHQFPHLIQCSQCGGYLRTKQAVKGMHSQCYDSYDATIDKDADTLQGWIYILSWFLYIVGGLIVAGNWIGYVSYEIGWIGWIIGMAGWGLGFIGRERSNSK